MGRGAEEDGAYGFKDAERAKASLVALQREEPAYARLTVRSLLARARRVLSITKAEEKVNNIKAAIEVFEEWTRAQGGATEEKSGANAGSGAGEGAGTSSSAKVEGLGFKNRAAAENSVRILQGRDPDYQRLAVQGLLKSAVRVLASTKDETKRANMNEAVSVLESALTQWATEARPQRAYLPLEDALAAAQLLPQPDPVANAFLAAYGAVDGEYKRLRAVRSTSEDGEGEADSWDIVRNRQLDRIDAEGQDKEGALLKMASWAYCPAAMRTRLRTTLAAAPAPPTTPLPQPPADNAKSPTVDAVAPADGAGASDDEEVPAKRSKRSV